MYIGIGPEKGKSVCEEDVFSYACQKIFSETLEERQAAMQIFREAEDFAEAEKTLTEWFYSGNWIREEPIHKEEIPAYRRRNVLERIWWVRYSDGVVECCARSYRDAVEMADARVKGTELTYVIY